MSVCQALYRFCLGNTGIWRGVLERATGDELYIVTNK